jgi:thiol-disulfide isomerase/thioredoxin
MLRRKNNQKHQRIWVLLFIIASMFLPVFALAAPQGIVPTTYEEFDRLIYRAKGSSVVVCIYASTCPASRNQIPILNQIGKDYGKNGLKLIVLSTDDSVDQLAGFLSGGTLYFEPLWLSIKRTGGLAALMKEYGGNYQNLIPYSALINRQGTVIKDWSGTMNYENYSKWVEYLMR